MEDSKLENCQTCLRPAVEPGAQPSTQWISACRCDRPYAPSSNFSIDICGTCKRRVAINADGKLQCAGICSCEFPNPQKVPTHLKQNESDVLALDLASAGLSPDSFPSVRYAPIAILGDGASATTVLARDKQRGTKVAVKCFKKISQAMQSTFQSEVKKNQQLSHTNIAKIVESGFSTSKTPYLVTEYKDGFNLEQYLALYGVPSYDIAVKILIAVCETLIYAQKQSVLHRDIKPGNIIFLDDMNSEPSISITDFALPKIKTSQGLSEPCDAIYMSCEEARGLEYSEKSEVYSLGCVGFSLLAGRPPFHDGTALDIKNAHALKLPPRISSIKFDNKRPSELDEIVEKCLEKDPSNRFESISKLLERLEVFPRREKMRLAAVLAARTRKKMLGIAAAGLLIVALSIAGYFVLRPH